MNVYRHPDKPSHIVIQSDRYSDALLGVLGDEDWDPGMQAFVLSSQKYISTRNLLVNKDEANTNTQIKTKNNIGTCTDMVVYESKGTQTADDDEMTADDNHSKYKESSHIDIPTTAIYPIRLSEPHVDNGPLFEPSNIPDPIRYGIQRPLDTSSIRSGVSDVNELLDRRNAVSRVFFSV